jgi:hypothetical protein
MRIKTINDVEKFLDCFLTRYSLFTRRLTEKVTLKEGENKARAFLNRHPKHWPKYRKALDKVKEILYGQK